MNVTYACPSCQQANRREFDAATTELGCAHCGQAIEVPSSALESGGVRRCLVCPSTDLYFRKDFPQRLGVGLVAAGIVGSSIAWGMGYLVWTFGILFATAAVDVMLYFLVGNALMCYRCQAQYRGVETVETHGAFNLETHERYRQMAARMEPKDHTTVASS